jgi:putative transposase
LGVRQRHHLKKGTTVTKKYQTRAFDTSALAVPEQVSVAMNEIAENMSEGLLALAVGAGLQVMGALMDADVAALAGPRGRHDPARSATRHGREAGSVTLGGRRVPVRRPRVRATDGSGELPVPAYELFNDTEVLGRMAMERMLAGLSTRRYGVGLEPVGEQVSASATATSRSAVSRRFVAMTETALSDLLAADLSELDLVAFMVDGVHFAESCCVVALGIDIAGTKHPLALVEGSTENATLVTELIVGLRERGLDVTKPVVAVLDGSKALRRAVLDVFDHPVLARCQPHKVRNVKDHLPQRMRPTVEARMHRLPRRLGTGSRGAADHTGPRAGQDPPLRRGQPARGTGRDTDRAGPGRATHPGPHPPLDKCHRVHDRHLP